MQNWRDTDIWHWMTKSHDVVNVEGPPCWSTEKRPLTCEMHETLEPYSKGQESNTIEKEPDEPEIVLECEFCH